MYAQSTLKTTTNLQLPTKGKATIYLSILVEPSKLPTAPQTCITEW